MNDQVSGGEMLTGNLDSVSEDGFLIGWCFLPSEPNSRRRLAVELNGLQITVVVADERRADLVAARVGDGHHAFSFQLPMTALRNAVDGTVSLRDVATRRQVGQDVFVTWRLTLPPEAPSVAPEVVGTLAGNLDRVTRDGWISGWCWYPDAPARRVDLAIFVDDEQVGEARAAQFRADLQQAAIGDGAHGFSFALPWAVLARKGSLTVSVREHPGGTALGESMTLRFGRLAQAEDRIEDLERQLRVLRATLAEARRDRTARDEERAARDLFRSVGTFFQELAEAPRDTAGAGVTIGLRGAVADIFQRFPPIMLARPTDPSVTICVDADAPLELLYACMVDLRACGVDAIADIVLADDGRHGASAALLPSIVGNLGYVRNTGAAGRLVARNEVTRTCRGKMVAFLFAGLRMTEQWLPTLLATFAQEPRAMLVASPVVREDGTLQHLGLLMTGDGGSGPSWRDFGFAEDARLPSVAFLQEVDGVADYAYAVRRDAFAAAGGFAEGFDSPAAATLDLCLRFRRVDGSVLIQPKAALTWPEYALALTTPDLEAVRGSPDPEEASEDIARIRRRCLQVPLPPLVVGRALVIDTEMPRPDRDAGSVAVMEHMRVLRQLGYRLTFIASNDPRDDESLPVERMERAGIEVARPPDTHSITQLLDKDGAKFDIVHINRHGNATLFLDRVRELAPRARILFSPSDLHFLREQRERALSGRVEESRDADITRAAELGAIMAADATIVFSDAERDLLRREVDPAKLHLLRWVVRATPNPPPFEARDGLCFVGNFRHGPNVDAVQWFAREIMPLLVAAKPGLRCHIVGDGAPAAVRSLATANLLVHGWVNDLNALLSSARLGIAPLRFGAGFKGKVATSLACGTPVIGTSITFEGTGLLDGDGVRVVDDPAGFARVVLDVMENEAEWTRLSRRGIERCGALYSPEAAQGIYAALLKSLGLPRR